ncbi:MAG: FixH family protein [Alphaproteobacteria bacterium]
MKTRKPGWWIPWSFLAFFAVVVSVNAGMIFAAFDTWSGLTTKDSYGSGIGYNKAIEAAAAQRRRGWRAQAAFVPTGASRGRIEISMRDRQGTALVALDIAVLFVRPTRSGRDFTTRLAHRGDGRYTADIAFSLPGQWRAEFTARRGRDIHRADKTIQVR